MALIHLQNVDVSIGGPRPLLERIDLAVEANERVCLIGRNGVGKSTLLQLIGGEIAPDDGVRRVQGGVRTGILHQEVPAGTDGTVFEVVAEAVGQTGALLSEFHRLSQQATSEADIEAMGRVQSRIDAAGGWDVERHVREIVTRLNLDEQARFTELSGGMKRRVLLARALAPDPDLLLLDEPTNHLDIDNIAWLESFLRGFAGSVVFITHDRSFLRALATRIVELDRGALTSWPGDYDNYLRRREERLNAEAQEQARFDKRLAQEEAWIRQGIKARRKRNMGRVRTLQQMRTERARRRKSEGRVRMEAATAASSGKRVIEVDSATFAYDSVPITKNFSTTILRGDRVGIIGRNGSGKTTLIRLLLGDLEPLRGTIHRGTNLQVAYFDQQRARLDERESALVNVAGGREFIDINGRSRHSMSYLQDFLFTPERARAPITRLSGGERNRLLLARLFSQPSNMLVMDEPTNDLDIETLELLEELVAEYTGTVLLVSHDREFLDRVVTSVLVLEGDGRISETVGGYSDWLDARAAREPAPAPRKNTERAARRLSRPASSGLSGREKAELEELPQRIEQLEAEIAALGDRLSDPAVHRVKSDVDAINERIASAQAALDRAFARWEELDQRHGTATR